MDSHNNSSFPPNPFNPNNLTSDGPVQAQSTATHSVPTSPHPDPVAAWTQPLPSTQSQPGGSNLSASAVPSWEAHGNGLPSATPTPTVPSTSQPENTPSWTAPQPASAAPAPTPIDHFMAEPSSTSVSSSSSHPALPPFPDAHPAVSNWTKPEITHDTPQISLDQKPDIGNGVHTPTEPTLSWTPQPSAPQPMPETTPSFTQTMNHSIDGLATSAHSSSSSPTLSNFLSDSPHPASPTGTSPSITPAPSPEPQEQTPFLVPNPAPSHGFNLSGMPSSESAPTDLSHLISHPDTSSNPSPLSSSPIPGGIPVGAGVSTSSPMAQTSSGQPVILTHPGSDEGFPKWIIGLGVAVFLGAILAAGWFIFGLGKSTVPTSLPINQQLTQPPAGAVIPTATPTPTLEVTPTSTPSATPVVKNNNASAAAALRSRTSP